MVEARPAQLCSGTKREELPGGTNKIADCRFKIADFVLPESRLNLTKLTMARHDEAKFNYLIFGR